jgi:hypothetical protein
MSAVCPRCRGFIPSNSRPGQYPGALSRADNATEICSDCGAEEAIVLTAPVDQWPVFLYYDNDVAAGAYHRASERMQTLLDDHNKT